MVRPVLPVLSVLLEPLVLRAPLVPLVLSVPLVRLALSALPVLRVLWVHLFMNPSRNTFFADNAEVIFVVLDELYDSAILVLKPKLDLQAPALMDIDGIY